MGALVVLDYIIDFYTPHQWFIEGVGMMQVFLLLYISIQINILYISIQIFSWSHPSLSFISPKAALLATRRPSPVIPPPPVYNLKRWWDLWGHLKYYIIYIDSNLPPTQGLRPGGNYIYQFKFIFYPVAYGHESNHIIYIDSNSYFILFLMGLSWGYISHL